MTPAIGVVLNSPDEVIRFAACMGEFGNGGRAAVSALTYQYESWAVQVSFSTRGDEAESLVLLGTRDVTAAMTGRDNLVAALRTHFREVATLASA